jgi:hypothetical protein
MTKPVKLVAKADGLREGLFGQVFLYVFEILPYLERNQIFPEWDIHAKYYGGEARSIIPGVLDLAYSPLPGTRCISLQTLRKRRCSQLGNDWPALHRLWSSFFKIPTSIEREADAIGPLKGALGIHFRGTDKQTATWDTNPVSASDMIEIVLDFRRRRPDLQTVFLATDDRTFAGKLRERLECEILNLGEVPFHKADDESKDLNGAKRALLDSVLLSRCGAVLNTSSALSAFAKVLNPELEIYRCAASKQFSDIPYFPVAYIEAYTTIDSRIAKIVEHLMEGDWSHKASPVAKFRSRTRFPRTELKWDILERVLGSPMRQRSVHQHVGQLVR